MLFIKMVDTYRSKRNFLSAQLKSGDMGKCGIATTQSIRRRRRHKNISINKFVLICIYLKILRVSLSRFAHSSACWCHCSSMQFKRQAIEYEIVVLKTFSPPFYSFLVCFFSALLCKTFQNIEFEIRNCPLKEFMITKRTAQKITVTYNMQHTHIYIYKNRQSLVGYSFARAPISPNMHYLQKNAALCNHLVKALKQTT